MDCDEITTSLTNLNNSIQRLSDAFESIIESTKEYNRQLITTIVKSVIDDNLKEIRVLGDCIKIITKTDLSYNDIIVISVYLDGYYWVCKNIYMTCTIYTLELIKEEDGVWSDGLDEEA